MGKGKANMRRAATAHAGHWYALRGGGFAVVDSATLFEPYPMAARVWRLHYGGTPSPYNGSHESYATSGRYLMDERHACDLVADLGTVEPYEVREARKALRLVGQHLGPPCAVRPKAKRRARGAR